jgi:hypothetical protein
MYLLLRRFLFAHDRTRHMIFGDLDRYTGRPGKRATTGYVGAPAPPVPHCASGARARVQAFLRWRLRREDAVGPSDGSERGARAGPPSLAARRLGAKSPV